jgi:hypothetical protein
VYYFAKQVHSWLLNNLTPAELRKATGKNAAFIAQCKAKGKLTRLGIVEVLRKHHCPLVTEKDKCVMEYQYAKTAAAGKRKGLRRAGRADEAAAVLDPVWANYAPKPKPVDAPKVEVIAEQPPQPVPTETFADVSANVQAVVHDALHTSPAVPIFPTLTDDKTSLMQTYSNIADALPDGAKCMILMPGRHITLQALYCVRALCDNSGGKIVFGEPESLYDVHINRNRMTHRFLQSDCTWSFWLDTDNIIPCERPEWYKRNVPASRRWTDSAFVSMNGINRLASHHLSDKTKKIVGALYFDRFGRGVPMYASARENADQRAMLNNVGPRNALVSAGRYAATGALLVHRQVYADIAATQPEWTIDQTKHSWLGYDYGYFDKIEQNGDDISFCMRATKAGHPPFVDLAVCAAHIGDYAYTHEIINQ